MPAAALEISKLTPQKDGNYAILINGEVFGRISAAPKIDFVIGGYNPKNPAEKPLAVLGAGEHTFDYNGKKLKILVRDLKLSFAAEDGSEKTADNNKKALDEVLSRVVVTEA